MASALQEATFTLHRARFLWLAALLLAVQLAVTVAAPLLYTRARVYLRQLAVVNEALRGVGQSCWLISHAAAGDATAVSQAQDYAVVLGELFACLVYGCARYDVPGVSILPAFTEFFLGPRGVDRIMKQFAQGVRTGNFDAVFTCWMSETLALSRSMTHLFLDAVLQWGVSYMIAITVCTGVVAAIVAAVLTRAWVRFVRGYGDEVAQMRWVLRLVPEAALEGLPLATPYLTATAWVDQAHGSGAEVVKAAALRAGGGALGEGGDEEGEVG
jgi:hypothetical protein